MAIVNGTAGNDFIHVAGDGLVAPNGYTDNPSATDADDAISSGGGGSDIIFAGGGSDTISFGTDLDSTDQISGGDGQDTLEITAPVDITFGALSLQGIERIFLPFVASGSYSLTTHDDNFNGIITIDAGELGSNTSFTLNYSAEIDSFRMIVVGGVGNDTIVGREGEDYWKDTVDFSKGGNDSFTGKGKVSFGGELSAGDHVSFNDVLGVNLVPSEVRVDGDYSAGLTLTGAMLEGVVNFYMGTPGGSEFSYHFTTTDSLVAPHGPTTMNFHTGSASSIFIDASAETDGRLTMQGSKGDDTLIGGAQADEFYLYSAFTDRLQGGVDVINGNGGGDFIDAGPNVTAEFIFDGGKGSDTLSLSGDYSAGLTFSPTTVVNIETIECHGVTFSLTTDDATVAAGKRLEMDASAVGTLTFNGMAELDGSFRIIGAKGDDLIFGGGGDDYINGRKGDDTLVGGDGADVLNGRNGKDFLTGGAGGDVFDFDPTPAVSGIGKGAAARDVIEDFNNLEDTIDVSTIDANGAGGGDAAFTFLAAKGAAFSGEGQLRWYQVDVAGTADDKTIIEGNTSGHAGAEFQIELTGLVNLNAGDFVL